MKEILKNSRVISEGPSNPPIKPLSGRDKVITNEQPVNPPVKPLSGKDEIIEQPANPPANTTKPANTDKPADTTKPANTAKILKPDAGTEKKFKTNDGKEYTVGMLGNDIIQFADGVWKDTKGWTTENIIKIKEKLYNLKRGDSVYDKNKQTTKFPLEQGAYTTKGDPYQYKVVNGQWFAKSLENRGKIFTNWVSLANNAKATSILDKRHPNARTVKPKVDNTQQKAGETQATIDLKANSAKYKDQFGQMSKDAENLPKTIFGTKGETNPTDNAERLNADNPNDL